jgi:3-oxoacyl-[acyl-carrier protein] reductase
MAESAHPFADRVALVTGAGQGIGRAIALRLAVGGARVVVQDLDDGAAKAVVGDIEAAGGYAVSVGGSVAESEVTDAMVAVAEEQYGGLDVLVNNAGITHDKNLHRMSDAEWNLVVDVVLRGTFNTCRSAARLMRHGRDEVAEYHRKVVNISSTGGVYGMGGSTNYSAAKAGVIGLTKALAREWGPQRINVNAIAPGYIEGTRLTRARQEGEVTGIPADMIPRIVAQIPIGRGGTAEDVADLVAFLASPQSDYLTGQVIELHGGLEIISIV